MNTILTNYREFMDAQIRNHPTVPMYAFVDSATKKRTEILPAQFKAHVMALAAYLLQEGYAHQHVALLGANSYRYILARQALLCCGCTVVFLDIRMETGALTELVKDSESCAIFFSPESEAKAAALSKACRVALLHMSKIDAYIETGAALRGAGKCMAEDVDIDPDALAFLFYTSGTTGRNKGVMLTQRSYIFDKCMEYGQEKEATGDTVLLLPLSHVFAETAHITTLMSGHTVYINQSVRRMFDDIRNERPQIMVLVPLFVQNLLDHLWKSIRDQGKEEQIRRQIEENRRRGNLTLDQKREMFAGELKVLGGRLYKIICGGAPVAPHLIREFQDFGIDVLNGYGATECSSCIAVNQYGFNRLGSVGWPLMGTQIRIDQPDKNGEGEVCIKGTHVMLGYYHKPEETAEVLRDGWFHTGDRGYLDEDNYLFLTGRIKNLIILSNGENVSPEELERRISEHSAVKEVQVYGEGEDIVAEIYPDREYLRARHIEDGEGALKRYILELNESLADYKRIHQVRFRDEPFEKTSSGKIRRK